MRTSWADLLQEIIYDQEKSYYIIKYPPLPTNNSKNKV